VLEFLIGGEVIEDGDGNQIGYRAPEVGSEPTPDGVSIELWTRAIIDGAYSGYFRYVFPRVFLRPSSEWTANASDALVPEFEGFGTQNANWGDGPTNDWDYESDRVWQYVQTDDFPIEGPEFITVATELTVTSVAVTPASDSLDLSNEETVQLTAIATMSDASTRDVTTWENTAWTTENAAVATVVDGLVTPTGVGEADITATYGAQSDIAVITVVA
jgi:Bacterial Ig-like domain (group 2)